MGRTIYKFHKDDEERGRKGQKSKHTTNPKGFGMRVINKWSEEEEYDKYDDFNDEYNANISQIQRKGNTNGY
jgi:hypothetical protein